MSPDIKAEKNEAGDSPVYTIVQCNGYNSRLLL